MQSFHLNQLIDCHTRVTETSSSLIDLIITNSNHIMSSGVIDIGLSDHSLVYAIRKFKREKSGAKTITLRSFKNFVENDFLQDLRSQDWSFIDNCSDVDVICDQFNTLVTSILDKHAPLKTHRVRNNQAPWISEEFLQAIKERDYLKTSAGKSGKASDWEQFRNKRNFCNHLKNRLKNEYFTRILHEHKSDGKKLWKTIKKLLPSKGSNKINNLKDSDGTLIYDNKKIANQFNIFFKSIGSSLASKFKEVKTEDITVPYNPNTFQFKMVSGESVSKIISSLDNNKSTGLDGVSVRVLKAGNPFFSGVLAKMMNKSMIQGKVPHHWKKKRVCPLFKEGDDSDTNNYRPISILPIPMKIFEKVVNQQFSDFIANHHLIHNFQSGFRKMHSTDTAVLEVSDYILSELSNGRHVGSVLIDFKKAFDTVDHTILLKKMFCYGFRDLSFDWVHSYLSDRTQSSQVNGVVSDPCLEEAYGVPQGSVLGPLFFLLYINDIHTIINCYFHLYADDTILIQSANSATELKSLLEQQLCEIDDWLKVNKLTINTSKTKTIFFGTKKRLSKYHSDNLIIKYKDVSLSTEKVVKYLGVLFDEELSWGNHIKMIKGKAYHKLQKLRYIQGCLTNTTKKLLVNALVFPYLNYCSTSWCNAPVAKLRPIQKLYERSNEFIHNQKKPISSLWNFHLSIITFKAMHGIVPKYLSEKITQTRDVHSHYTRFASDNTLRVRFNGNKFWQRTFQYRSPEIWNSLPSNIRNTESLLSIKSCLKSYFNL